MAIAIMVGQITRLVSTKLPILTYVVISVKLLQNYISSLLNFVLRTFLLIIVYSQLKYF